MMNEITERVRPGGAKGRYPTDRIAIGTINQGTVSRFLRRGLRLSSEVHDGVGARSAWK